METKKPFSFVFLIIAIIVGSALYREFDFEKRQFKNTALGIIYLLTFVFAVYVLVKGYRKGTSIQGKDEQGDAK